MTDKTGKTPDKPLDTSFADADADLDTDHSEKIGAAIAEAMRHPAMTDREHEANTDLLASSFSILFDGIQDRLDRMADSDNNSEDSDAQETRKVAEPVTA